MDTQEIFPMPEFPISPSDPNKTPLATIQDKDNTLPSWIKCNTPATMFADNMDTPKRDTLVKHQDTNWYYPYWSW